MLTDTSLTGIDTTLGIDSTIVKAPIDSTARIKYFRYDRKDRLNPLFGEFEQPLLLSGSKQVEHNITFDSLNNVIITETLDGQEIKYPIKIPFDKYLQVRSRLAEREQFYRIAADFYKIETQDELEQLFKNITEITIPLPFATETIFGPPTINLKINGVIDITGSYQKTYTDQVSTLDQSNTQNNINFKQEVQVTTKGTIGDKLTIDADWNSQRTFEYENQLKLKYKGYPDEVVQSIEAGNVSLDTRSNLIGSTQALFGVKAQFKLGPLTLTAIASQKKSEKKEVNVTGGTQETPFDINIYDYAETNYLLDSAYEREFTSFFNDGSSNINITQIEVWVTSEANNFNRRRVLALTNINPRTSVGYDDTTTVNDSDGYVQNGVLYKLDPSEYTVNSRAGYITLNNPPQNGKDAVCVAFKVQNISTQVITQYGDFVSDVVSSSRLTLKMLRAKNMQAPDASPSFRKLWDLMLKNIYNLRAKNVGNDPANLTLKIFKLPSGATPLENYVGDPLSPANGKTYLNLTKLDIRRNSDPTQIVAEGDGYFDFFPGRTIDLVNGNIIFPSLRPFYDGLISAGIPADTLTGNNAIYNSTKLTVSNQQPPYVLRGTVKGEASNRYSLGFNIVEGSVKVFNGSTELSNGNDYTIDYSSGELIIRNVSALTAGSNLKITYESNDLFTLASKTLLGTRAELNINKTSYIGFTLINLKQQTLNDKVRIGEEPTNNTIMGFDGGADIKTNFLTKLLNKIPGYNTKEESILSLKGEIAVMLPNPNTKTSNIPSDNGDAIAYVDDFEGSKKTIPLGLSPLSWTLSSMPVDSLIVPPSQFSDDYTRDSVMSLRRSKLDWFNLINDVPVKEVFPNKTIASNQNQNITPFVFDVKPDSAGIYNYSTDQTFNSHADIRNNWSGIFKYLNTSQTDLVNENINYIEVWMKINDTSATGNPGDSAKMMIDLGLMSERIIANKVLTPKYLNGSIDYHTEDFNGNGQLDPNEDVGIDGYTTTDEKNAFNAVVNDPNAHNIGQMPDPSRDNFSWITGSTDYTHFNGTENNATTLTEAKRVETEDLNNSGTLDLNNSYFEYVIPVDRNSIQNSNNPYIVGGGNNGWYQFNIPLDQFKRKFGSATLTNIQYARVWFKGFERESRIKIVSFDLVGNQWIKNDKTDSSYSISVVNIEDNSNVYQPPVPGNVLRQQDQTQTDPNVLSNEQSLSLDIRKLFPGQERFIYKDFTSRPLDLINYKILKLFVNGDSTFRYINKTTYDAAMVIRIGTDTSNFYEYRAPIHPDRRPFSPWEALNEVKINLAELTSVKQAVDTSSINSIVYRDVPNGPPGSKYGVKGNPSIRDVRKIFLGVANSNGNPIFTNTISGSVWFNEMRVLKTNDQSGYAFTVGAGLKIADLGTLSFSYSKTDPNFHNLEGRFGSLDLNNSWDVSGTINVHKIINALLANYVSVKFKNFFTIPLTFSHSEVYDKPKYLPNTDVELETAAQNKYNEILAQTGDTKLAAQLSDNIRIASQNLLITNRISLSGMKFTFPGDNFIVKEVLNKIEFSYYRNSYTERSPTLESRYAWDQGGNIGLASNLNILDKLHLNLGKLLPLGDDYKSAKLYFFFPFMPLVPLFANTLTLGTNFTRNRDDQKLRASFTESPTSRNFTANRNIAMDWKFIENWIVDITGNYAFTSGSDLTYLETSNDSLRLQRNESSIFKDIFLNHGLINFGKDLNYTQTVGINPKFNIPGFKNFVDLTGSYRSQYGWRANDYNSSNGNNVGYSSDLEATAFLKLNQVFKLFQKSETENKGGGGFNPYQNDQNAGDILKLLGSFVPDQVSVTFSQNKQLSNPGVTGRPGFGNFWNSFASKPELGPSRLYQLGWVTDPGRRAPNLNLTDLLGTTNSVTFNTFITPIFPNNLKLTFSYKTSLNKNTSLGYNTDQDGNLGPVISNYSTRIVARPTFFVSSDIIPKLGAPYNDTSLTQAEQIASAFENNVISAPFPSWNLTLTGVEKFDLFSGFASAVSIESGYSSEYRKTYSYTGLTKELITAEALTSGFSPLIGINITFKPIAEGNMTASFKLSKTNNLTVDPNNATINNTSTSDLSINASYTKSGFSLPLFGLALKNDITISFSYTSSTNDPEILQYSNGLWNQNSQNGTTNITLNPSIQYALSKSVSLQLFYKYTKIAPIQGSILLPTRTSNEAGLNIKLTIQ